MATYPAEAWRRLGALLRARRGALSPSYKHRTTFCEATSLDYRVVFDIEQGKRENFGPETLALLERGYELKPGTITGVLEGGELEISDRHRPVILNVPTDDGLVKIPVPPGLPEAARAELRKWGIQMARYLAELHQDDATK